MIEGRTRWRSLAAGAAAIALLVFGTARALEAARAARATWPPEADALYLPAAHVLQAVSMGHHELLADLVAARANVYYGTQVFQKAPTQYLQNYLDTAATLDPHFRALYERGGTMLVYNGQTITVDSVEAANRFMERGLTALPDAWELSFQIGFNLAFELPPKVELDDPRRAIWRARGSEFLRKATENGGAPPWVASIVANMLTKRGERDLAIKHLERVYANTQDGEARDHLRRKLAALVGEQQSERLAEERQDFEATIQARYPYAPEAFSLIAGPRCGSAPPWIASSPSHP